MSGTDFHPFRAFISYSHADSARCEKLHRALEAYRVDRDLVGRITPAGPVPRHLAPVFRDRTDFSTGPLQEQTLTALGQSQFLVVIASPAAAKSAYVNDEIRQFKAIGGAGRICVLIAEGKPPENFPPALRFRVTPDGAISGEPEPRGAVAGDVVKDGEREAFIKIVAGLIGLPYDYLWMRDVKAQRKRTIAQGGMAAVLAVAIGAAGVFGYEHYGTTRQVTQLEQTSEKHGERLANVEAIVRTLLSAQTAQAAPGQQEQVRGAVASIAAGAEQGDRRLQQALALLKDGKIAEAEPVLQALAADKEKAIASEQARIAQDRQQAAEAWRNLGAIAGLRDPKKAREAYAKAVDLAPDNADALYWNGWFQFDAGNLTGAEKSYAALAGLKGADPDQIYWARSGLGDIAVARGDLPGALVQYKQAQADMQRLAKSDPGNVGWQRDLSVSYEKIGDVLVAQGNLTEALKSFRDGLAIRDRLAKSDPGDAGWQRDLSVSYDRVGDVLVAQGNLTEALKSFRDGLAIADRLAKSDPGNAGWQSDLSVSYEKIGDVLVNKGNLTEALKSFRDGLAIRDRLAKSDPGNAGWQRDLSVSYDRVGDVLVAQGNLTEALKSFRDGLAIADRLAKSDPGNAGWQSDLSVSYEKIGDVLVNKGNLTEALKSFRDGLAIRDRLAKSDPGNAGWQRDLSVSYIKIGDVLVNKGNLPDALKSFRDGLAIADRLAKSDPGNAGWQRDLSVSYIKIGDVLVKQGHLTDALKSYRDGLAIADRLAKSDPGNAGWQRDLSVSYAKLAVVFQRSRDKPKALESLRQGREIMVRMTALSPDNATWKKDLAWFDGQIAALSK